MGFVPFNPLNATEIDKISWKIKETQAAIRACVTGSRSHEHYKRQLRLLGESLILEMQKEQSKERLAMGVL
jgi:hypothetical protein